jgi:hypothetical protein
VSQSTIGLSFFFFFFRLDESVMDRHFRLKTTLVKPWPPWLNGTAVVYNNDTSLAQKSAWTE